MASSGALLVSEYCNTVLATHHSTAPMGCAHRALDHSPLPDSGGFSEHCALRLPRFLRPRGLSDVCDRTTHHLSHGVGRSSGCGVSDVGRKLGFLSGSARLNYCRTDEYSENGKTID